jgi:hypothetical protein
MRRVLVLLVLFSFSCVPMPDIEPKTGKGEETGSLTTPTASNSKASAVSFTSTPGGVLSCAAGYEASDEWGCVISEERAAREREADPFRTARAAAERLDQKVPPRSTPYKGTVVEVIRAYTSEVKAAQVEAESWNPIAEGPSQPWSAAARCRQAEIYEAVAHKLELAEPPAVTLFTAKELSLLDKLDRSGREDLVQKGAETRAARVETWRKKRQDENAVTRQNNLFLLATCVLRAVEERFALPVVRAGAAKLAELEGSTVPATFAAQVDPPTLRLTGKRWQAGLFTRAKRLLDETR